MKNLENLYKRTELIGKPHNDQGLGTFIIRVINNNIPTTVTPHSGEGFL